MPQDMDDGESIGLESIDDDGESFGPFGRKKKRYFAQRRPPVAVQSTAQGNTVQALRDLQDQVNGIAREIATGARQGDKQLASALTQYALTSAVGSVAQAWSTPNRWSVLFPAALALGQVFLSTRGAGLGQSFRGWNTLSTIGVPLAAVFVAKYVKVGV